MLWGGAEFTNLAGKKSILELIAVWIHTGTRPGHRLVAHKVAKVIP